MTMMAMLFVTQDKESDESLVSKEAEMTDDHRQSANDESQTLTPADRRVTRSAVRQQQSKSKQKAESSTNSAHDSTPRMSSCSLIGWQLLHLFSQAVKHSHE